jgi:hypothetical protein
MTDQFALFMWTEYEACGGVNDLICMGSFADCMHQAGQIASEDRHHEKLGHIAALPSMTAVKHGAWQFEQSPYTGHPQIARFEWSD